MDIQTSLTTRGTTKDMFRENITTQPPSSLTTSGNFTTNELTKIVTTTNILGLNGSTSTEMTTPHDQIVKTSKSTLTIASPNIATKLDELLTPILTGIFIVALFIGLTIAVLVWKKCRFTVDPIPYDIPLNVVDGSESSEIIYERSTTL